MFEYRAVTRNRELNKLNRKKGIRNAWSRIFLVLVCQHYDCTLSSYAAGKYLAMLTVPCKSFRFFFFLACTSPLPLPPLPPLSSFASAL